MPEEFDIPDHLKQLFSDQPGMRKEQERLRRKYGYDSQTIRMRGQAEINHAHYEREILLASEGLASLEGSNNEDAIRFESRRLAENLMKTGQFEDALTYAVDDVQRAEILKLEHACMRDDKETCACPDTFVQGVHIPHRTPVGQRFSPKHGGMMDLVVCSKCGDTNHGGKAHNRPDISRLFRGGQRPSLNHLKRQ